MIINNFIAHDVPKINIPQLPTTLTAIVMVNERFCFRMMVDSNHCFKSILLDRILMSVLYLSGISFFNFKHTFRFKCEYSNQQLVLMLLRTMEPPLNRTHHVYHDISVLHSLSFCLSLSIPKTM